MLNSEIAREVRHVTVKATSAYFKSRPDIATKLAVTSFMAFQVATIVFYAVVSRSLARASVKRRTALPREEQR